MPAKSSLRGAARGVDRHGLSPVGRPAPAGLLALVAIAALMAACEKRPSDPVTPRTVAAAVQDAEASP